MKTLTVILWAALAGASPSTPSAVPALKGLDPVSLVEGKEVPGLPAFRAQYGKFTYAFASKAHQEQFLGSPERYAIQGEGRCLHMRQMEGNPNLFKVVDGRIYLAANESCLSGLQGDLTAWVKDFNKRRTTVAILLFPGVQIIDYAGPWEAFGQAGYDVFSVAATAEPLNTNMRMKVTPNYTFANAPKADVLVLPGGGVPFPLAPDDPTVKWIRERAKETEITMSVCNGAFWLANTGLLDGQRATTTTNANLERLAKNFPRITVVSDERFVDNGRIITTAGLSSGIDGALHVVERFDGRGAAQSVALNMEYDWQPDVGYARGALAEKYISRLGDVDLPKGVEVKNGEQKGDRQRWERTWEITGPQLSGQKLSALVDQTLAKTWRKTGTSPGKGVDQTSWAFKGDDGKPWKGLAMIKPLPGSAERFAMTLAVQQER